MQTFVACLDSDSLLQRDLKPQNLLLSDTSIAPTIKIADFGFARDLQPQRLADTLCGSPLYMAPEILQFHKYDAKVGLNDYFAKNQIPVWKKESIPADTSTFCATLTGRKH